MSILDAYRSNTIKKKAEIAHLTELKMKEVNKFIELNKKCRQKVPLRHYDTIQMIEKKIAVYDKKITQKNKEYLTEQRILNEIARHYPLL